MKSVIIIYTQLNKFGGIETLFLQLADFLKKKKIKLVIICYENKLNFQNYNSNIKIIKLINKRNFFNKVKQLENSINKLNYIGKILLYDTKSAVYINFTNIKKFNVALTDPPNLNPLKSSKSNFNMKLLNKIEFLIKDNLFRKFAKDGIEKSIKTFVMNKWNYHEFKKTYDVIPKIINPGTNVKNSNIKINYKKLNKNTNLNLITISRLVKKKNICWILKGLKKLIIINNQYSYFKNITLRVIGSGIELNNLKKKCTNLNIKRNVIFCGYVSEKQKRKLILKSQLNIIAAESAYNLTSLESLFLGVPVLINEGCKMKEIYKKNKMVFHTKNNEINFITSFVQCINKLKKISIKNYNISNLPTGNSWSKKVSKLCNWI